MTDPVTGRIARLAGILVGTVDLLAAIAFGLLIECTACTAWLLALPHSGRAAHAAMAGMKQRIGRHASGAIRVRNLRHEDIVARPSNGQKGRSDIAAPLPATTRKGSRATGSDTPVPHGRGRAGRDLVKDGMRMKRAPLPQGHREVRALREWRFLSWPGTPPGRQPDGPLSV
jgi:hypothetical protein